MRSLQRARPHRIFDALPNSFFALVAALAFEGATVESARAEAKKYDVRAPSDNSGGSRYEITNPSLADELNRMLTPLIGANQVCDYNTYSRLWKPARDYIADAAKLAEAGDKRVLMNMWGRMPDPHAAGIRFQSRHCAAVLNKDFSYNPPGKQLDVRVPCLVLTQADESDILWCTRRVRFYSEHMKAAVQIRIERVNAAVRSCDSEDKYKREKNGLLNAQRDVIHDHYRGDVEKYREALTAEYAGRGRPIFMQQHEETVVSSLLGNFPIEERYRAWCRRAQRR
jgi:hypothetical protein